MALSAKRQAFVEHYLKCWNASEAARLAGYSERTAGVQAHDLLKNPEIREAIVARLKELKMGADEVLIRLTEQAQGAAQYLIDVKGNLPFMDWERLQSEGKLHLIKKLSYTSDGRPQVEFYDAQTALIQLGRAHGLFTDRSEVSGPGGGAIAAEVKLDLSGLTTEQLRALAAWDADRKGED